MDLGANGLEMGLKAQRQAPIIWRKRVDERNGLASFVC